MRERIWAKTNLVSLNNGVIMTCQTSFSLTEEVLRYFLHGHMQAMPINHISNSGNLKIKTKNKLDEVEFDSLTSYVYTYLKVGRGIATGIWWWVSGFFASTVPTYTAVDIIRMVTHECVRIEVQTSRTIFLLRFTILTYEGTRQTFPSFF